MQRTANRIVVNVGNFYIKYQPELLYLAWYQRQKVDDKLSPQTSNYAFYSHIKPWWLSTKPYTGVTHLGDNAVLSVVNVYQARGIYHSLLGISKLLDLFMTVQLQGCKLIEAGE